MSQRHSLKTRGITAVLCLSMFASGCYGPFNLTRQVHHWNGTVSDNEWIQEGIYFFGGIAYALAAFADSLVFNSIEFWGGENPVPAPTAQVIEKDGKTLTMEKVAANTIHLTVTENGSVLEDLTLTQDGGTMSLVDLNGDVLATAMSTADGQVLLRDLAVR